MSRGDAGARSATRRRFLAAAAAGAAGTAGCTSRRPTGDAGPAGTTPPIAVRLTHDPDEPAVLRVRVAVDLPARVDGLRITVREAVTVQETSGLAPRPPGRLAAARGERTAPGAEYRAFRAEAGADRCVLEFALDAGDRPNASFPGEDFGGTADWLFAPLPEVGVWFRRRGRGRFRGCYPLTDGGDAVTVEASAPWLAGDRFLFVGDHVLETRAAADADLTLVRPAGREPPVEIDEVFATLARAAGALDVGAAADAVLLFLLPDPLRGGGRTVTRWTGRGGRGVAELYVHERSAAVDTPNNVWVHELVHTRQLFATAPSARWFVEASAEYYAALLTVRQGRASPARAIAHLTPPDDLADAVLAEPDAWPGPLVPYAKGGLVLLALDRRIRLASGGDATLLEAFRRCNERPGRLDLDGLAAAAEAAAGTSLGRWFDRHVAGPTLPDVADARLDWLSEG